MIRNNRSIEIPLPGMPHHKSIQGCNCWGIWLWLYQVWVLVIPLQSSLQNHKFSSLGKHNTQEKALVCAFDFHWIFLCTFLLTTLYLPLLYLPGREASHRQEATGGSTDWRPLLPPCSGTQCQGLYEVGRCRSPAHGLWGRWRNPPSAEEESHSPCRMLWSDPTSQDNWK